MLSPVPLLARVFHGRLPYRPAGRATLWIGLLALTPLSPASTPAQAQSPNQPAAAILSSGGRSSAASEPAARGSLRTPQPNAAWTAAHNPLAGASSQYSSEQNSGQQNPSSQSPSSQNPGSQSYSTTPTPTTVTAGATRGPAQPAAVVTAAAGDVFPRNPSERQHIPLKPPSDQSTAAESRSSSTLQMLFSVGSSLLIVTGLFLGLAWCYRKSLNSAVAGGLPKQVVHVLGRTSLSSRQQMVVLRFGNKLVLVSVIQGEARTLSEITDPLEVDQLVGLCESGQPGSISNSFKSVLLQEGRP